MERQASGRVSLCGERTGELDDLTWPSVTRGDDGVFYLPTIREEQMSEEGMAWLVSSAGRVNLLSPNVFNSVRT